MGTDTPVCTIIGGPNGSGKSTIYDRLALPGHFVNADVLAREINAGKPEEASLLAGRRTLLDLAGLVERKESFVYETTLSSHQSIELMRTTRHAGYRTALVFIGLNSADLNVERVAQRVARGGHDIPEATVRRRYDRAMSRVAEAIRLADDIVLFDNSASSGPNLVLRICAAVIEDNRLDPSDPFHRHLAQAAGQALSMSAHAVLIAARPQ